jgi:hypothetical protein
MEKQSNFWYVTEPRLESQVVPHQQSSSGVAEAEREAAEA